MTTETKTNGPPPLPGDCVPIPQVTAAVHDVYGQVGWTVETHVVPELDLDGYGSPVVLVPPDRQDLNQFSMYWRLFVQRGDCGHELGVVGGMDDPVRVPGTSHGLHNFSAVEPVPTDGSDDLQGVGVTTYVFNGEYYVGGRTEYR